MKVTSTFCLCVNGELKLGKEPQGKGLCSRRVTGRLNPNPHYYPLKSWILFKRSTKPNRHNKTAMSFHCFGFRIFLLFEDEMLYVSRERDRHCVQTSFHTVHTSLPHFTLPMLEHNQCTSTLLCFLH